MWPHDDITVMRFLLSVSDEPGWLHQYEPCCRLGEGLQSGPLPAEIHGKLFISSSSSFIIIIIIIFSSSSFIVAVSDFSRRTCYQTFCCCRDSLWLPALTCKPVHMQQGRNLFWAVVQQCVDVTMTTDICLLSQYDQLMFFRLITTYIFVVATSQMILLL